MTTLPPQPLRDAYWTDMEAQLKALLYALVFAPILATLKKATPLAGELRNAGGNLGPLIDALRSGRVQYAEGAFGGTFSVAISKDLRALGATHDLRANVWRLSEAECPGAILAEAARYQANAKAVHILLEEKLDQMQTHLDELMGTREIDPLETIRRIDKGFEASAEALKISPRLDKTSAAQLAAAYRDDLQPYIKGFARESIQALHRAVEDNAMKGYRFDRLTEMIRHRYGVTANKAKFLARQETGVFMAKYRKARFTQAGVRMYRWSTSRDERVRASHKHLDGRTFSYDNPPITDTATGARNNPGEDFNCLPGDSRIDFAAGIEKGFRRWYDGEMTTVVTDSGKTIRATPNHPMLTLGGWKAIGSLNESDHLIELTDERLLAWKLDRQHGVATLGQIFKSLWKAGVGLSFPGKRDQFHGDGSNEDVDIVGAAWTLRLGRQRRREQGFDDIDFSSAYDLTAAEGGLCQHLGAPALANAPRAVMAGCREPAALSKGQAAHAQRIGFRAPADSDSGFEQPAANDNAFQACALRNGQLTLAADVRFDDRFWINLQAVLGVKKRAVLRVTHRKFSGHVFNLQTTFGHYTSDGFIVSNCRCVDRPLLASEIGAVG